MAIQGLYHDIVSVSMLVQLLLRPRERNVVAMNSIIGLGLMNILKFFFCPVAMATNNFCFFWMNFNLESGNAILTEI